MQLDKGFFCIYFRIKLEPGISSVPEFYHGDPEMPIHARPTSGYPVGDLIRILLQSDMADQKVCTVQPLGISENAAFIVDVETVDYQDLKADDRGSWRPTGTKKSTSIFLRMECYVYQKSALATCHQYIISLLVTTTPISLTTDITV